jgi:hypothetical protein
MSRNAALAFAADALLVLAFVLIGRASHDENPLLGALVTYWPFLAALVVGWAVTRGWRNPFSIVRTGVPVWLVTVGGGVLLRAASDQGVQLSFVVVTSVVLGIFLLGWRGAVDLVARSRRRRAGR